MNFVAIIVDRFLTKPVADLYLSLATAIPTGKTQRNGSCTTMAQGWYITKTTEHEYVSVPSARTSCCRAQQCNHPSSYAA